MAYQPFEVDSSWSWEKQKQEYKKAANAFKNNNPDATLKDFYTANGQLIQPDGTGLQLKPKAKTTSPNYPDYQPKIKATTDVEINKRKIAEEALDEDSAKAWKKEHITDWNKKTNPTGKPITKDHPLFRRWEHRIKVSDNFWKSETAKDLGFKAGDVENLIYTNPSQWKLKDPGEQTYGRNFVFDIDKNTGEITYTPRSKFTGYDFKYAKPFKGNIPIEELTKEANYAHEQFGITPKKSFDQGRIRWNSKYSQFLKGAGVVGAYSVLNTDSVEAASSMLSTGVNKDDTVQFAKGIGKDIAGQLTWAAAAKGLGGNGLGYISPYAMKLAPIMLGYQAKNLGDAVLQGANGEDLQSQGEIAEAGKQYREANGWSNGKSDRQNYRHGTSLKVDREMIDNHNLTNGNGDSEFQENYRFNQAMDKRMRESKQS